MDAPNLAIVSAFVDPLVDLVRAWLGFEAHSVRPMMSRDIDPPPAIAVTITTTGALRGGITWTFSEQLARDVAARLLAMDPRDVDEATYAAAAAELANIAVGRATAALLDAGYVIEIQPPVLHVAGDSRQLPEQRLAVTIHTSHGDARVLIGVEEVHVVA